MIQVDLVKENKRQINPKVQTKMENTGTLTTLNIQNKNTTHKANKMSNTDPAKKRGMNSGARKQ